MGLFDTGVNAVLNLINMSNQKQINAENQAFAQTMTQLQWLRDDNATQRLKKDVEAAGFSPLAVIGSSAGNSSALSYQGTAPQIDASSIANSIAQAEQYVFQSKQNDKDRQNAKDIATNNNNTQKDIATAEINANKPVADASKSKIDAETSLINSEKDYQEMDNQVYRLYGITKNDNSPYAQALRSGLGILKNLAKKIDLQPEILENNLNTLKESGIDTSTITRVESLGKGNYRYTSVKNNTPEYIYIDSSGYIYKRTNQYGKNLMKY